MLPNCSVRQISQSESLFETAFCFNDKIIGAMAFRYIPISLLTLPKQLSADIKRRGYDACKVAGLQLYPEYRGKGLATPLWAKAEALRASVLPENRLRLTFDIAHEFVNNQEIETGWTVDHFKLMQSLLEMEGYAIINHWQQRIYKTDSFLWEVSTV